MYQVKRLEFNMKDKQEMEDFHGFINILLRQEQQMCIWRDEDIVCVEYDYLDRGMAEGSLEWLGPDEKIVECSDDNDY